MNPTQSLSSLIEELSRKVHSLMSDIDSLTQVAENLGGSVCTGIDPWSSLTIFILACFVGYYVVWSVTPALHSPLMAVTNAISSVIIVGAILGCNSSQGGWMGCSAVFLASINIVGGFFVTYRMLEMFNQKKR